MNALEKKTRLICKASTTSRSVTTRRALRLDREMSPGARRQYAAPRRADDLVSYGTFGCTRRFEPARGVQVQTYATTRIRGAILRR